MPPAAAEVRVFERIGELLHELAEAVERYARQTERQVREGQAAAIPQPELAELAAAWNRVGAALAALPGAPVSADAPRQDVVAIEESLTRVLAIVRRQTGESGDGEE